MCPWPSACKFPKAWVDPAKEEGYAILKGCPWEEKQIKLDIKNISERELEKISQLIDQKEKKSAINLIQ